MINIITTGGTIEGLDNDLEEIDTKNTKVSIRDFLETANVSFPFTIEKAFKKDSRFISNDDRKYLVEKIKASETNRILITHGTFTIENTAKYIGNHYLNKTIVLGGSFILGTSKNTDAFFNLGYAIGSLQFLRPDVYVAMNGKIFHCKDVTKNIKMNRFENKR